MNDPFPAFFRLKQTFDAPSVADPAAATRAALEELSAAKFIKPGMTVAVGAGSRGISNYDSIVRAVCDDLKRLGAQPFIIPAMGSHGGATSDGQRNVLASYGITEETMGVPVRSSMEVVELGRTGEFIVYRDRNAAEANAIVLVNRIKPHTDFHGPLESGLMKMGSVGLGKQKGALQFHQAGARSSLPEALVAISREAMKLGKIVFGVAILENQRHQTAQIVAVPAAEIERREMALLEQARRWMPKLPFDEIDLLIVDEIGKNLSGTGMDTNVIRRDGDGAFIKPGQNAVGRIYARSLHPHSFGNATGLGLADFIHDNLFAAMDVAATRANVMTSLMSGLARVPLRFPTDRGAIEFALPFTGRKDFREVRALWIKNTLSCGTMFASEAYLNEARKTANLTVEMDPAPLKFDERGDLSPVF